MEMPSVSLGEIDKKIGMSRPYKMAGAILRIGIERTGRNRVKGVDRDKDGLDKRHSENQADLLSALDSGGA